MTPGFLTPESMLLSSVHCVYSIKWVRSHGWQDILFWWGSGETVFHTHQLHIQVLLHILKTERLFSCQHIIDNNITTVVAVFYHLALQWVFLTAPFWNKNLAGYLLKSHVVTEKGVKSVCLCSSQIMPSVFLTRNLDELEVVDAFSLAFTVLNNLRIQSKYIVISSGTFAIITTFKTSVLSKSHSIVFLSYHWLAF